MKLPIVSMANDLLLRKGAGSEKYESTMKELQNRHHLAPACRRLMTRLVLLFEKMPRETRLAVLSHTFNRNIKSANDLKFAEVISLIQAAYIPGSIEVSPEWHEYVQEVLCQTTH